MIPVKMINGLCYLLSDMILIKKPSDLTEANNDRSFRIA